MGCEDQKKFSPGIVEPLLTLQKVPDATRQVRIRAPEVLLNAAAPYILSPVTQTRRIASLKNPKRPTRS